MRVGLIAPPWIPVPPPAYGGTEAVVDNLARGLQAAGHEVRLFTIGESTCPVPRDHLFARGVEPFGQTVPEAAHVLAAYERMTDVDVVHDHTVLGPLLARRRSGCPPVVATNHGPFNEVTRPVLARVAERAAVIAISYDHARRAAGVPLAGVIHHGIDLDVYRPGTEVADHVVFVGRMSPDKGVDGAVRIAHRAGRPLKIVTKMRDPEERAYFERVVRPLLSEDDEYLDELALAERIAVVRSAACLVNPIQWAEPFGLVMAESLAVGTPVVAYPRGSAPEIVTHGQTGYLVSSEEEAASAIDALDRIDRMLCRRDAEARFSLARMTRDHVALYRRVIAGTTTLTARDDAASVGAGVGAVGGEALRKEPALPC
jgi:glycosyltransferase involved in cell wall biosynthesis